MWKRTRYLWQHHRKALLALCVVLIATGVFGARTVRQIVYWSDPAKADQPLQPWMTPRYVGRSYDIPVEVVQAAFAIDAPDQPHRVSLETIAREKGVTLEEMQAQLDAAVAAWRSEDARPRP